MPGSAWDSGYDGSGLCRDHRDRALLVSLSGSMTPLRENYGHLLTLFRAVFLTAFL